MTSINLMPVPEDVAKYGPLAYVTLEERERIMHLPFGASKREIERLQKEIKTAEKAEEKRIKDSEASINAMPLSNFRRDMTSFERHSISQLQNVRFPLGSKDKNFVIAMVAFPQITERQAAYIRALVLKYRRQL